MRIFRPFCIESGTYSFDCAIIQSNICLIQFIVIQQISCVMVCRWFNAETHIRLCVSRHFWSLIYFVVLFKQTFCVTWSKCDKTFFSSQSQINKKSFMIINLTLNWKASNHSIRMFIALNLSIFIIFAHLFLGAWVGIDKLENKSTIPFGSLLCVNLHSKRVRILNVFNL